MSYRVPMPGPGRASLVEQIGQEGGGSGDAQVGDRLARPELPEIDHHPDLWRPQSGFTASIV